MNYLEMVNLAIRESGVDLDELILTNFANPPDRLHVRFKDWVNRAWGELQLERSDWTFGVAPFRTNQTYEEAGGNVRNSTLNMGATIPTLFTNSVFSTTNLVAGNWVRGRRSGAQAMIAGNVLVDANNINYPSTTRPQQGYAAQLFVGSGSGTFFKGEKLAVYDSTNTVFIENNDFTVQDNNGFRLYSRSNELSNATDILIPDYKTFQLVPSNSGLRFTPGNPSPLDPNPITTQSSEEQKRRLIWVEWEDFVALTGDPMGSTLDNPAAVGIPQYFTKDSSGLYRFFPTFTHRDNILWDVYFLAKVRHDSLSSPIDVPLLLPEEYHEAIVWRAVMEYADWDNKPNTWNRARKKYQFHKLRMEENLMQVPKWRPNPFYSNHGGKR